MVEHVPLYDRPVNNNEKYLVEIRLYEIFVKVHSISLASRVEEPKKVNKQNLMRK